ncbi:MAG TPA: hypothetical protein VIL86_03250 [Tepidisphaeraceae bacterium]|jgi:hypothetical protein
MSALHEISRQRQAGRADQLRTLRELIRQLDDATIAPRLDAAMDALGVTVGQVEELAEAAAEVERLDGSIPSEAAVAAHGVELRQHAQAADTELNELQRRRAVLIEQHRSFFAGRLPSAPISAEQREMLDGIHPQVVEIDGKIAQRGHVLAEQHRALLAAHDRAQEQRQQGLLRVASLKIAHPLVFDASPDDRALVEMNNPTPP